MGRVTRPCSKHVCTVCTRTNLWFTTWIRAIYIMQGARLRRGRGCLGSHQPPGSPGGLMVCVERPIATKMQLSCGMA